MNTGKFILAYVKSMRLYYAFITGIAGWIGVSFYHFCMPDRSGYLRSGLILVLLFLSYGINQIINDYLGLPEDRINAPNRPMVTGALHPKAALMPSIESSFYSYSKIVREKIGRVRILSLFKRPLSFIVIGNGYSPGAVVDRISPIALLLIHGTFDRVIHCHHSRSLYRKGERAERVVDYQKRPTHGSVQHARIHLQRETR